MVLGMIAEIKRKGRGEGGSSVGHTCLGIAPWVRIDRTDRTVLLISARQHITLQYSTVQYGTRSTSTSTSTPLSASECQ